MEFAVTYHSRQNFFTHRSITLSKNILGVGVSSYLKSRHYSSVICFPSRDATVSWLLRGGTVRQLSRFTYKRTVPSAGDGKPKSVSCAIKYTAAVRTIIHLKGNKGSSQTANYHAIKAVWSCLHARAHVRRNTSFSCQTLTHGKARRPSTNNWRINQLIEHPVNFFILWEATVAKVSAR